jgi:hypothetical protein
MRSKMTLAVLAVLSLATAAEATVIATPVLTGSRTNVVPSGQTIAVVVGQ